MKKLSIAAFLTFLFFASATWLSQEATPVEPAPPRDSIIQKDPPAISPLKGDVHVSSSFGMRMHPILKVKKQHKGTDFKAPMGTPVYATSDGIVEKVETQEGGYGKFIVIRHDEHYQTLYAQLSEMYVQPGQRVERGDHIGAVGSSGASTAPHLHYEVKKDGVNVDPERYLRP